ncbi:MAG: hypothetical protein JNK90_20210 [Planctomycetaceae bacterium]|nr:hypothetical protein [Planctomycetaceae bacterium]
MMSVYRFLVRFNIRRLLLLFVPLSVILLTLKARSDVETVEVYVDSMYVYELQKILDANAIQSHFTWERLSGGLHWAEVSPSQIAGKEAKLNNLAENIGFEFEIHYQTKWKQFSYSKRLGKEQPYSKQPRLDGQTGPTFEDPGELDAYR